MIESTKDYGLIQCNVYTQDSLIVIILKEKINFNESKRATSFLLASRIDAK